MNLKLVESLLEVIIALPREERLLLEKKYLEIFPILLVMNLCILLKKEKHLSFCMMNRIYILSKTENLFSETP